MEKKEASKSGALEPKPNVLVSCRLHGKDNALAVAYCANCSHTPPMIAVAIMPSRYSHHMIKESGCFVVNIPEKGYEDIFNYLGSVSGKDHDKLKEKNVRTTDGIAVDAPILTDCPVNIECKVVDSVMTGSHELFIGRVEYVHARESLIKKDGRIDYSKVEFINF